MIAEGPGFERVIVARVLPGSPAAEAGMQVGDELRSIDGEHIPDVNKVRQAFRRENRESELLLRRGDNEIHIQITLRNLL